jgi:ABC-type bacteriocin/lantibiotic exporter with double-glycine peptidase domain
LLRDNIGYVGQMPVLFAGSIIDNIKVSSLVVIDLILIYVILTDNSLFSLPL